MTALSSPSSPPITTPLPPSSSHCTLLDVMSIETLIEAHLARAVDLRHRLHQIPELLFEEFKTAKAIRAELDHLGIPHIDGVENAPTATIALIGDPSKTCIALRADIDALPILEQTQLPYASTHPGRMHACGHDGHSATLCGVAGILKSIEKELHVCVKLLWQPAEEGGGGGERLVLAGVLDGRIGPKVRAIFGLHGWPGLPVGVVATKPGPLLAATDSFEVIFHGRGGHAAYPHLGADPIVAACNAVINLQQFVSREMDPTEPAVITIGIVQAGTATNVIPDTAKIAGTARTLSDAVRKKVQASLIRRCQAIATADNCTATIKWEQGYPATVNDPAMADYVATIARKTFGPERYIAVNHPSMGGEDFAYYLEKIPGCFLLVGVEPPGKSAYPNLHTDLYDFTDATVGVGMKMFLELVTNFRI
jgi:amidohydrolase